MAFAWKTPPRHHHATAPPQIAETFAPPSWDFIVPNRHQRRLVVRMAEWLRQHRSKSRPDAMSHTHLGKNKVRQTGPGGHKVTKNEAKGQAKNASAAFKWKMRSTS